MNRSFRLNRGWVTACIPAVLCVALMYSSIASAQMIGTKRAFRFLKQKQPCVVWIVGSPAYGLEPDDDVDIPAEVGCVFFGVTSKGTVNETRGCMYAIYNLITNSYDIGRAPTIVEGRRCSSKIVEEVLSEAEPGGCDGALKEGAFIGGKPELMPMLKKRYRACGSFVQ